jgi:hypothetical protein
MKPGKDKVPDEGLMTEQETADFIHMSVRTLQKWRSDEIGPPYYLLQDRFIRYDRREVRAWLLTQAGPIPRVPNAVSDLDLRILDLLRPLTRILELGMKADAANDNEVEEPEPEAAAGVAVETPKEEG